MPLESATEPASASIYPSQFVFWMPPHVVRLTTPMLSSTLSLTLGPAQDILCQPKLWRGRCVLMSLHDKGSSHLLP
jgi:hypothetical protein